VNRDIDLPQILLAGRGFGVRQFTFLIEGNHVFPPDRKAARRREAFDSSDHGGVVSGWFDICIQCSGPRGH
jgi:hypothetical protein